MYYEMHFRKKRGTRALNLLEMDMLKIGPVQVKSSFRSFSEV
jgi:hypothetical protein